MIFFAEGLEERGIGEATDIEPVDAILGGEIWEIVEIEDRSFDESAFGVFGEANF